MDDFQPLATAYEARASASPSSKLDLLMDIERLHDPRVVPFLLNVLADQNEPDAVRIHVLKQLRYGVGQLISTDHMSVAMAISEVLAGPSRSEVRVHAALALGRFTHVDTALSHLGAICLVQDESIDLRYAAFTSLERAGPTPESIALLRKIASDDTLGGSARTVLSAWHVVQLDNNSEE